VQEERIIKKIEKTLENYKNVPFVHNGRTLDGLDCLGFVVHFYSNFGIRLPDSDGMEIEEDWYKNDPLRLIRNINRLNGIQVSKDDLQPLDLVYFAIAKDVISHMGVMVNSREFAHMSPRSNFIISKMERQWKNRCRGAIRFISFN